MAVDTSFLVRGPSNRSAVLKRLCNQHVRGSRNMSYIKPIQETLALKEETIQNHPITRLNLKMARNMHHVRETSPESSIDSCYMNEMHFTEEDY